MSAALVRQIQPLEWDATRNEPFLRLPAPLSHIILTPPRPSDAEDMVEPMNDPKVYNGLRSTPWPFTLEHGQSRNNKIVDDWHGQLRRLEEAAAQGEDVPRAKFGFTPVRCIRDTRNEKQLYLGEFYLRRTAFDWEVNEAKRKELADANEALPSGDPGIVYTLSCWLRSSHHGQGIMSAVAKAIITQWAIPRMNARHFLPGTFEDNAASAKVFVKLGFKHYGFFPDALEVKARGDLPAQKRSVNKWELKVDDEGKPVE
ncbi:hypothetical protein PENSPDRAFT_754797 [Peniophora sp. CONT]|nr:hypothetical protein PENSPDRAFT_754797 [Peniophora sp. CONT]